MRPALVVGGIVGVLLTTVSAGAQAPPDVREVIVREVLVRSGPNEKFYATSRLLLAAQPEARFIPFNPREEGGSSTRTGVGSDWTGTSRAPLFLRVSESKRGIATPSLTRRDPHCWCPRAFAFSVCSRHRPR